MRGEYARQAAGALGDRGGAVAVIERSKLSTRAN